MLQGIGSDVAGGINAPHDVFLDTMRTACDALMHGSGSLVGMRSRVVCYVQQSHGLCICSTSAA